MRLLQKELKRSQVCRCGLKNPNAEPVFSLRWSKSLAGVVKTPTCLPCAGQKADRRRETKMVRCRCNLEAILKTSWTDLNPGRRFYCCPKENGCGIIDWHDKEMCKRSKEVIPGLLRNINRKQKRIDELEAELDIEKGQTELLKEEAAELKLKIQSLRCELRNQRVKVRVGICVLMLVFLLYLWQSISVGDVPQMHNLPLPP